VTSGRVVVIGLDGATFTLLKPWMEAGALPHLKSLIDGGVHGPLASSIPPATLPAWQCFMTGKNPGKLGIAGFFERRPDGYEGTLVGTVGDEGETLWELLSRQGKRVAVLNVPFTTPPKGFNGVMVGGFTTPPSRKREFFYPEGLCEEIEAKFGEYRMDLKTPPLLLINRSESLIEEFLEDCEHLSEHQFQVAAEILDRQEFDVVMFYQLVPDRIQHRLWYLLDESHPWYDAASARRFSDRIVAYYRRLDEQIAHLVQKVGAEPTVMILSDHGFGPISKGIDLNSWLLRENYIRIKSRPLSRLKFLLWKLGWGPSSFVTTCLRRSLNWSVVKRWLTKTYTAKTSPNLQAELGRLAKWLFLSRDDIDWSRTKAYCLTGPGLIRINLAGREPEGSVSPEAYAALREEIAGKLRALTDPMTNRPILAQVVVREEAYHGRYLDRMPDIVYMPFEGGYLAANPVMFTSSAVVIDGLVPSGFHRMQGIFLASGPPIVRGAMLNSPTIMDLAPTVLYLMGGKIPQDMDGRVLTELFEEVFLAEHPIVHGDASPEAERPRVELSTEDQLAVLERLKGLGYID
jgi:predicted AlkP superfamily phosphohydrolase/phosphomutase